MSRYHERTPIGGGQYAPSGAERDEWESWVENRTDEIASSAIAQEGAYSEALAELYNTCAGTEAMDSTFYPAARELAESEAYEKFGFCREHF